MAYINGNEILFSPHITINESGSNACDGIHSTIDVTELPTENIDENALYRLKSPSLVDVAFVGIEENTGVIFFGKLFNYHYVKTRPTNNIEVSYPENEDFPFKIHLYYIEDENDIFVYTEESGWQSITEILVAEEEKPLTFKGLVTSVNDASEEGYYGIVSEATTYYKFDSKKRGMVDILFRDYGSAVTFSYLALARAFGVDEINLYTENVRPTENIKASQTVDGRDIINLYYIIDENAVMWYEDGEWNVEYPDLVVDVGCESIPVYTQAVVYSDGWVRYQESNGVLSVTQNGVYSVEGNTSISVLVPNEYINGVYEFKVDENGNFSYYLDSSGLDGWCDWTEHINFKGTVDGEITNFIGIRYDVSGGGDGLGFVKEDGSTVWVCNLIGNQWDHNVSPVIDFGEEAKLISHRLKSYIKKATTRRIDAISDISNHRVLSDISLSNTPEEVSFRYDGDFNYWEMGITRHYTNGEESTFVADYWQNDLCINVPQKLTEGKHTIIVQYSENGVTCRTFFDITVAKPLRTLVAPTLFYPEDNTNGKIMSIIHNDTIKPYYCDIYVDGNLFKEKYYSSNGIYASAFDTLPSGTYSISVKLREPAYDCEESNSLSYTKE